MTIILLDAIRYLRKKSYALRLENILVLLLDVQSLFKTCKQRINFLIMEIEDTDLMTDYLTKYEK